MRVRRQRNADEEGQFVGKEPGGEADEPQEASAAEPDDSGWRTSTAHLSVITRLVRVGVWTLVASGPVFGVLALLGSSETAEGGAKPVEAPAPASQTGPAGFAELFVAAYLRAGQGSEHDLAPYYSGSVALSVKPGTRTASQSTVIASREVQPGYWSVTVAADVTTQDNKGKGERLGVQYFRVGIQAIGPSGAGGATSASDVAGYAATSLPAQVSAPSALTPGALAYESERGSSSTNPSVETARGFLTAYLVGTSELDRYTSPDAGLRAISPAPYAAVKVTGVRDDSASSGRQRVPADGTVLHQLVQIDATDRAGSPASLSYALTLTSRAGRWEVASVDDAPVIRANSTPTAEPEATAAPDTAATAPSPSSP